MTLDRVEDTVGYTTVITINNTDEQFEPSLRTCGSGRGLFYCSLEAGDDERAEIFERYDILECSFMGNIPMEELQELVFAFSSLEEDSHMVLTLHAMQLLDLVDCDVGGQLDQAVDFMDPDQSGMITLVDFVYLVLDIRSGHWTSEDDESSIHDQPDGVDVSGIDTVETDVPSENEHPHVDSDSDGLGLVVLGWHMA